MKTCDTCEYAELTFGEMPCEICDENHLWEAAEGFDQTCRTCRYIDVSYFEDPCDSCLPEDEFSYSNWRTDDVSVDEDGDYDDD
jgi:hypothetical protein